MRVYQLLYTMMCRQGESCPPITLTWFPCRRSISFSPSNGSQEMGCDCHGKWLPLSFLCDESKGNGSGGDDGMEYELSYPSSKTTCLCVTQIVSALSLVGLPCPSKINVDEFCMCLILAHLSDDSYACWYMLSGIHGWNNVSPWLGGLFLYVRARSQSCQAVQQDRRTMLQTVVEKAYGFQIVQRNTSKWRLRTPDEAYKNITSGSCNPEASGKLCCHPSSFSYFNYHTIA